MVVSSAVSSPSIAVGAPVLYAGAPSGDIHKAGLPVPDEVASSEDSDFIDEG